MTTKDGWLGRNGCSGMSVFSVKLQNYTEEIIIANRYFIIRGAFTTMVNIQKQSSSVGVL